ncbi:MAG: phosphoribosylglycinamide formyltransferase [archaeon]
MTSVGVLASGRGSNFRAIVDHRGLNVLTGVEIGVLLYNYADAPVATIAEEYGIPARLVEHRDRSRLEFETEIVETLGSYGIELVCLAGWDRIIGSEFFSKYRWRIMNIHPALLPAFGEKGLNADFVHEAVLQYGAKVTGCSVYFIDVSVEKGPIILQKPVEIREREISLFPTSRRESVEILSDRVLMQEHRLYSKAIQLYAEGRLQIRESVSELENSTRRVVFVDADDNWEKEWTRKQQPFLEHQRELWASNKSVTSRDLL